MTRCATQRDANGRCAVVEVFDSGAVRGRGVAAVVPSGRAVAADPSRGAAAMALCTGVIGDGDAPSRWVRTRPVLVTFLPEERDARHGDNNEHGDDSDGDGPLDTAR